MTPDKKIAKAKAAFVFDHPFFACLLLSRLKVEPTAAHEHAATDGERIMYNPVWLNELTLEEVKSVLARGVLKAALGHCWRMGDRDPNRWGQASDFAINPILQDAGLEVMQDTGHYGEQSVEVIYSQLQEQDAPDNTPESSPQGDDSPDMGDKTPGEATQGGGDGQQPDSPGADNSDVEIVPVEEGKEDLEEDWRQALSQAAAAQQGKVPGNLKRMIDEVMAPDLPWYVLMRDFVERTAKNDFDWSRPNKKFFVRDIIMPSLRSDELPEICVLDDTSGSITKQHISEHSDHLSQLLGTFDTTLRVIYVDQHVQGEQTFTSRDLPLRLEPQGGGGTDFRPGFEHIREKGYNPACVIYFTDLCCYDYPDEPEWPVLWIAPKNSREDAPFGQTVRY